MTLFGPFAEVPFYPLVFPLPEYPSTTVVVPAANPPCNIVSRPATPKPARALLAAAGRVEPSRRSSRRGCTLRPSRVMDTSCRPRR